ncbi:uncharacterized protein PV09_08919 [Verruconis gallopava]|uniref:Rieske domain-containing protein n=1 Tax=Verruconis gallopava TaxID=253628 RepID=A0A0D1ZZ75_9PEZI|nr:uncharacterized protein PV09_08919 [Verruconis gallopava]KIV99374.1 hypothetical protein PV09_08919 [Verruconis gallopava]
MALPFIASTDRAAAWFSVGLASSFVNITDPGCGALSGQSVVRTEGGPPKSGCKVFLAPDANDTSGQAVQLPDNPDEQLNASLRKGDQVLVFQYRGKFHAVDNKCPHSSYPLSNGTPFDIEDFGIALSAGITCPKHGWSFDLFSGQADRGTYRLKLWEVQLRDVEGDGADDAAKEVWVRRRQRVG